MRPVRAGKGGAGAYNGGSPVEDKKPKKKPSKVAEYAKAVYKEKAQGLQHWAKFVSGSAHWKHSELLFEKKELVPDLQQLLAPQQKENGVTLNMVKYS